LLIGDGLVNWTVVSLGWVIGNIIRNVVRIDVSLVLMMMHPRLMG
jgi:hypothetical protein